MRITKIILSASDAGLSVTITKCPNYYDFCVRNKGDSYISKFQVDGLKVEDLSDLIKRANVKIQRKNRSDLLEKTTSNVIDFFKNNDLPE